MDTISGVAVGIVTDNKDPEGRGRVRVRVSSVRNPPEVWARCTTPARARSPELEYRPGDQVLVAFELGDARSPYVIGLLWNGGDAPTG